MEHIGTGGTSLLQCQGRRRMCSTMHRLQCLVNTSHDVNKAQMESIIVTDITDEEYVQIWLGIRRAPTTTET